MKLVPPFANREETGAPADRFMRSLKIAFYRQFQATNAFYGMAKGARRGNGDTVELSSDIVSWGGVQLSARAA
jgi:hypothetical protein